MTDIYDTISRPQRGYIMPPPQRMPAAGPPADPTKPPPNTVTANTLPLPATSQDKSTQAPPPPSANTQGGTWQQGWQASNIDFNSPQGQSIAQQFTAAFGNPYAGPNGSGSNSLTNSQWIIVPATDAAAVQQMQQQVVDPSQILPMRDASGNIVAYVRSDKNVQPQYQHSSHGNSLWWDLAGAAVLGGLGAEFLPGLLGDAAGGESLIAGLQPMAPLTAGEFTPMLDVPGFADSLTPGINSLIDSGVPPIPDPVMQPPPTVDIPPPDMSSVNITDPTGGGVLSRVGNYALEHPGQVAGLGLTGAALLRNHPNGIPQNLTDTLNRNTPLGNQATTDLQNRGQLTPQQQSTIDATIDQQYAQGSEAIIQSSINAGQGGKDSMVVQDKLRAFKGQLETMRQQLYMKQTEENISVALRELGLIDNEQFLLAQLELQQDNAAQQRAMSIMQSLGWLWSASGDKSTKPTGR